MPFFTAIFSAISAFFGFMWALFVIWTSILAAPIKHPNLLWILIPVWLAWFFGEFFQEKKSTNFGNAITNGVVPLWVGIDWVRFLVNRIINNGLSFSLLLVLKFAICLVVFLYGFIIIIQGIRANRFVYYFGRIRETTYAIVMFAPFIYGAIDLTWKVLLSMIVFFPIFYFVIELIDRYTPNPKPLRADEGEESSAAETPFSPDDKGQFKMPPLGGTRFR